MSTPSKREQHRETLRAEILDAARRLFARDGYEATSIRRIADLVGCSPGILYHYFEDKPSIMAHLVRESFSRLHERLSAISTDDAPVLDSLRRGLRAYIEFGVEHPHHYNLLFRKPETEGEREQIMEAFANEGMHCFDCLRRMTAAGVERQAFREDLTDSEEVAQALWAGMHGMVSVLTTCEGFPFVERTRLIDRLVDILVAGVRRH